MPKAVAFFASFAFILLFIFSKSVFKIRFIEWGAGTVVVALVFGCFCLRANLGKKELIVLAAPFLWMGVAAIATPFAYNVGRHAGALLQTFILTSIAVAVVFSVFSFKKIAEITVLLTAVFWTLINSAFFLAWISGRYSYNGDFSGLVANRNQFAVQTVLILIMLFAFVPGRKLVKYLIICLSFPMILFSLSIKGFVFFLYCFSHFF